MKPANFPARKDQRRLTALKSMNPASVDAINTLAAIRSDARDVRTKKDRSARGKKRI